MCIDGAVEQALCNPRKDNLYVSVHGTSLPGGTVSLCYAATALCSLDELLRCLIDEEVQSRRFSCMIVLSITEDSPEQRPLHSFAPIHR